jgi:DNA (cytosine-5)-methyltransferase 1
VPAVSRGARVGVMGLVVDNFAGGGGASTGIEAALGRPVDIAINHSPEAIAMHAANHPHTRHFCENILEVDPREACGGRPVDVAWFSPDCKHFSRAKGATPRDSGVRGLAWVVIRWAKTVRPAVIILENVKEFETWGPLRDDGRPDAGRVGETFREWLGQLTAEGYSVEFTTLTAADYGAPTTRERLFLVARRDGSRIAWPEASHGRGRVKPWRTAAEIVDWSLPCQSIFARGRPLAEATLRRIAAGVRRYVVEAARPFIVPVTHTRDGARVHSIDAPLRTITTAKGGEFALVAPTLIQTGYGEREGQAPRVPGLHKPLGTVVAGGQKHALVSAFLTKFYGTAIGASVEAPLPTVTANGQHLAEVRAFLVKYYGSDGSPVAQQQELFAPLHTVTTKARFGLVTVHGEQYEITDIGLRMLSPGELFAAQGFPRDYVIAPHFRGRPLPKVAQVALAGNSVCPDVAEAVVRANVYQRREAVA